jgi:hypothetical protein
MDAKHVEILTTSSPTVLRRINTYPTSTPSISTTPESARTSASTSPASTKKGGFNKEAIKKKFLKKVKAKERAFLTSVSDLDNDTDDDRSSFSPLRDDEFEKRREDKLTGHCFIAKSIHGGYYTVAMDEGVKPNKDVLPSDDDTTEVKPPSMLLLLSLIS